MICLRKGELKDNKESIVDSFDGVNTAIKHAKRRMAEFKENVRPSNYDPGTKVHELVIELKKYLD